MADNMSPMDFQNQDMSANPMDGGFDQTQGMENGMTPDMGGNEFDTNFDAGVEANEEEDPKKYIQQLTGKLSQTLRKYNEDNGQPDVDLNKYVAGMIAKQEVDGLSEEDTKEILDKIKADEDFEMDNGDMQGENREMNAEGAEMQQPDFQQQQPNESSIKRGEKLEEIANDILKNNKEEEKIPYQQTKDKNSFRKKPFTSPNFKS